MKKITYRNIEPIDFKSAIDLATAVHGEGYIDEKIISAWYKKGIKDNKNTGFVAYDNDKLVGFRLTYAVGQWQVDNWCSPELWLIPADQVCYFKCNTVDESYRGHGIGGELLNRSIIEAKKQGAIAGISHLWMQSPGNSAVRYFTKCGGNLIKEHPDRWNEISKQGYDCPVCHLDCHCVAAEMIIRF